MSSLVVMEFCDPRVGTVETFWCLENIIEVEEDDLDPIEEDDRGIGTQFWRCV